MLVSVLSVLLSCGLMTNMLEFPFLVIKVSGGGEERKVGEERDSRLRVVVAVC